MASRLRATGQHQRASTRGRDSAACRTLRHFALHRGYRIEYRGQLTGQRRAGVKRDAGTGPLERNGLRMQERALQAMKFEFGIAVTIAIFVVTQQRVTGEGGVNADLMRAPRRNVHFHQRRERTEELHRLEYAHRVLAGGGNPHVSFAVLAVVGRQRRVDAFGSQLPATRNQAQNATAKLSRTTSFICPCQRL